MSTNKGYVWPTYGLLKIYGGALYSKAKGRDFKNLHQLKKFLIEAWKEMDQQICSKMMSSIPKRLKALIDKKGEQVFRKDWE